MTSDLALVLSGGGARAAYQAGVLAAIAEVAPTTSFPIVTGVSAGAINTVALAAHPGPFPDAVASLKRNWENLTADEVYRVRPVDMLGGAVRLAWHMVTGRRKGRPAFQGLMHMRPLSTFLSQRVVLNGIEANIAAGRLHATALSATCYSTGATVTFVQGALDVPMWSREQRYAMRVSLTFDHLLASAAIPIAFPAVKVGDQFYGDGSVRQAAPLAPAIHLGARRIVAVAMRAQRPPGHDMPMQDYPSSAEVFGLLFHSIFLDAIDTDAERMERINQTLAALPSGTLADGKFRKIHLLLLRPSRDLGELARGHDIRLPPGLSWLVRAMGGRRARAADFVSYLMFNPPYTSDLMDLGYHDTLARRAEVQAFLSAE